ncbi:hypothetical protein FVE85_8207 [Porphyridium purpureum]|uniref:Uncharacterized protein n=1 Tax=Porphyridium purpureum TaxID=35688 RepID=A0A5J4YP21_PORPP|nr:hypothetical protein FVE85_8207 [Porphyridium purpureum]|eukprot:POR2007..scf295_9
MKNYRVCEKIRTIGDFRSIQRKVLSLRASCSSVTDCANVNLSVLMCRIEQRFRFGEIVGAGPGLFESKFLAL